MTARRFLLRHDCCGRSSSFPSGSVSPPVPSQSPAGQWKSSPTFNGAAGRPGQAVQRHRAVERLAAPPGETHVQRAGEEVDGAGAAVREGPRPPEQAGGGERRVGMGGGGVGRRVCSAAALGRGNCPAPVPPARPQQPNGGALDADGSSRPTKGTYRTEPPTHILPIFNFISLY